MAVVCKACGCRYRYEEDNFCPRCGAYNRRKTTEDAAKVREEKPAGAERGKGPAFPNPQRGKGFSVPHMTGKGEHGGLLVVGVVILACMVLPFLISACGMLWTVIGMFP